MRDLLFGSLPLYFSINDTYKNIEGKGLLERYLSVFQELLEEYKTDVLGFLNFNDSGWVSERFLGYYAFLHGNPPTVFRNTPNFRKVLKVITQIKWARGTEDTFYTFFSLLGLGAELTEVSHIPSNYDDSETRFERNRYDSNCVFCREYDLNLTDPDGIVPELAEDPIPEWVLINIIKICEYLLPVNMGIRTIYFNEEPILDTRTIRKYTASDSDIRIAAENLIREV